jgi:putative tryptophan/tyrosine transport system substrate-binding protein
MLTRRRILTALAAARAAATIVDKILNGARPGDIPIEQATRFTTVVSLRPAKTLEES